MVVNAKLCCLRNEAILEMVLPIKIGGDRFECVRMLWPKCEKEFPGHDSIAEHRWKDCALWLNSVKEQGKKKRKREGRQSGGEVPAAARSREAVLLEEARVWVGRNTGHLNLKQQLVVQKHVDRAAQEAEEERHLENSAGKPLMLLVHGGPGTGKSAVIFALKNFYVEVMKFEVGQELLIASLQASVAAMLGGETLHHVAGINPFHSPGSGLETSQEQQQKEASKRLAFARHLIIDEVFMLSASFFAEAEAHIRAKVPQKVFFATRRMAVGGILRGPGAD